MGNKFLISEEVGRVPYKVVKGDNDTPRVEMDVEDMPLKFLL